MSHSAGSVAIPRLRFRLWHAAFDWLQPERFIDDVDLFFRIIFIENRHLHHGLLIEANGRPWNDQKSIESPYNMISWFTAMVPILQGGREQIDVWAYEESDCRYNLLAGDVLQISDERPSSKHRQSLAPVRFHLRDFVRAMIGPGQLLLALHSRCADRMRELTAGLPDGTLPELAERWCSYLSEFDLSDELLAKRGPFVVRSGTPRAERWARTRSAPLAARYRQELSEALSEINATLTAWRAEPHAPQRPNNALQTDANPAPRSSRR